MSKVYDAVIVGAGAAGMFAAHKLLESAPNMKLAIVDKGKDIKARALHYEHDPEGLISGAGGSGLFSDGKLVLTLQAGGKLSIPEERANRYLSYIDSLLTSLDGASVVKEASEEDATDIREKYGLLFKPLKVRHLGSHNLKKALLNYWQKIDEMGAKTYFEKEVVNLDNTSDHWRVFIKDRSGRKKSLNATRVIFAVGKEKSIWLSRLLDRLYKISSFPNRTYFGVRLETFLAKELSKLSLDPKLFMYFNDDTKIKTHCFNRRGEVLKLNYSFNNSRLPLAGGHSPFTEKNKSMDSITRTSFAVLLGDTPEDPFDFNRAFAYMKRIHDITRGKLLVQRVGDFKCDRPTTMKTLERNEIKPSLEKAVPGNIAGLDLPFNFNTKFLEFMDKLSKIDSNVFTDDTLIYSPVVEWWMSRINTDENMETEMKGLYVIGDGAGVSQGIVYSAVTGLIAAESILNS